MPANTIKVLLIEDNPGDVRLIEEMLKEEPGCFFMVECFGRLEEAIARIRLGGFDVLLLDLSLPDSHGLDTFLKVQETGSDKPVILLTGLTDEVLAAKAVRLGRRIIW